MATQNPSTESRAHYWRRVLRPMFYWVLLVLVLFGIRTHQRWMERTRLDFNVTLQGQAIDANATFDGKPAYSGQKIPLGNHTFTVTHPKGEIFSTNMFVWYGEHNFGTIDLKRTMGTLLVTADPPAPFLFIRGPEWSVTLTNSSGLTKLVPTDAYTVEADYPHWQQSYPANVFASQTTSESFAPHFGGLQLGCNQPDATYQLQTVDGQFISEGRLPATMTGLPAGIYKIVAVHHRHERPLVLTVKADTTTPEQFDFNYGAAVFETIPDGAVVTTADGQNMGVTPLRLGEIPPGNCSFTLQRNGYQSVQVSLNVAANQTNFISTNLVSETYVHAFNTARQYMAAADYERALQSAGEALIAKPDDAEAIILQNEATGLGDLQRAQTMGQRGDYVGGDKELNLALQSLPDNQEIKGLIADFKQHEPAQLERERSERLNRPGQVFTNALSNYADADLFDEHELTTSQPFKTVGAAIALALQSGQPAFQITATTSPQPETYQIEAVCEITGFLGAGTTSGRHRCIIVCGQTKDDETQILFKVMEYKAKTTIKFSIANLLNTATTENANYIPIHPSKIQMTDALRAQLTNGVQIVTERIQSAIGQTPAPPIQTPPPQ